MPRNKAPSNIGIVKLAQTCAELRIEYIENGGLIKDILESLDETQLAQEALTAKF